MSEPAAPRLGELERQVMEVLWARGTLTTRQVAGTLPGRQLAYTTVATVLTNLHRKGMVERGRSGRVLTYRPRTTRERYAAELMRDALDVSQDRQSSIMHFVQDMPAEDVELLRRLLDEPGDR